jgi:hypothetical protein
MLTGRSGTHFWILSNLSFHSTSTSWNMVPSRRVNPPEPLDTRRYLTGIEAISGKAIRAVGKLLTEHWDGKSWSVIARPNPGPFNLLFASTAVSDRTVAAVGAQTDPSGEATGIIVQDPGSAPKTPTKAWAPTIPASRSSSIRA